MCIRLFLEEAHGLSMLTMLIALTFARTGEFTFRSFRILLTASQYGLASSFGLSVGGAGSDSLRKLAIERLHARSARMVYASCSAFTFTKFSQRFVLFAS
jgi:hypothetical protein